MKFLRLLVPAVVFLAGCAGYKLGPIKPSSMTDVKTIAVPVFKNDTLEPRIEVMVTDAIIRQIQQDGTYKVVSADKADAVIDGTISQIFRRPQRSVRGNVLATQEFTEILSLEYKLVNRVTGAETSKGLINGSTSFFVSGDIQQDERQAIPLAAEDAAIRLIAQLSEGW